MRINQLRVLYKIISILMMAFLLIAYIPMCDVKAEGGGILESIEFIRTPKTLEYTVGDSFDTKGMRVVAYYDNGDFENLSNDELSYMYDFSEAGEKNVEISYTKSGVKKLINLTVNVYEKPLLISENGNVKKGDIIEIPVKISGNMGLMGIKVVVSYDDAVLKPIEITDTEYFSNGFVNDNIATSEDNSFYVIWNGTECISEDGLLFKASFRCISEPENGKTEVVINSDRNDTFTENYNTIAVETDRSVIAIEKKKSINVKPLSVAIRKGSLMQLNVTTVPEGLDVEWVSNDNSIVTVDSFGKIKGISSGDTIVRAQLKDDAEIYKDIEVQILDETQIEHEHEWNNRIVRESSCKEVGIKLFYCPICGDSYEENIQKKNHVLVDMPAETPSCTEDGKTIGKKCSSCGEIIEEQNVIEALGHDYGEWEDDVQNGGHFRVCKKCQNIENSNHRWDNGMITTDSGCLTEGIKTFSCIDCCETKTEPISAKGHKIEIDKKVSATCASSGLTEGSHCSVCHEVIKAQETIAKLEHVWDEGEIIKEATSNEMGILIFTCQLCGTTKESLISYIEECDHSWDEGSVIKEVSCTDDGEKKYTCSKCGKTKIMKTNKLGHDFGDYISNNDANCIKDGTATSECIRCHVTDTITLKGSTTGIHDWGDAVVINEANCNSTGTIKYLCSICGEEKEEIIPIQSHTIIIDPAVPATTISTGLTEGSHCSVCGATIKAQEVIPKLLDNYDGSSSGKTDKDSSGDKSTNPNRNEKYSNEWVEGKWYDENGYQTYDGSLMWKSNSTGWWVEDTAGWYPQDSWQKIDGVWYYFKPDGYMASGEYYNGYWFNTDGSWDDKYLLSWKSNSTGWWVEDISGWWPSNSWIKIDGDWYYFNASGYMVTNQYIDGFWIGSDGVCR